MAIQIDDTNVGILTLKPAASGNYSITFPAAVAAVNGHVLSSDTSGNLSWIANGSGGSMIYPASGIPNSTGSAWGTSYSTTGSGTVVALQTQPSFTTDIRTPKVTTASAANLVLDTNAGTTTGNITITTGSNGAINITPNGTGAVGLVASTVVQGVSNTNTTLTTNGTGNLILNTNNGTNAGSIVLNNGVNGNIAISPNGTGTTTFSTSIAVANASSNFFTLAGAASGTGPTIAAAGATDANVNFNVQTKGTGSFVVASTTTNTTSNITASGANPNINLVLAGKGTGVVDLGAVGSVRITGGSNTNLLSTNGSGVLSWVAAPTFTQVYPASGIPNSTGSAWGTSYSTTGSGTVVALQTQPSFTTDIRTPKVTTAGAVNLVIDTNAGTSTGNITLNTGLNGNISIIPNGTGSVLVGDQSAAGTVTTGTITANLTLNTNNGTSSGSIVIAAGVNGNISITPNGTGVVDLGAVTSVRITGGSNTNLLSTNGSGVLSWVAAPTFTQVYPASGIPNSTGSAWGTSYSTTGSSTVVALGTSPSFVTDIRTPTVTTSGAVSLILNTNTGTSTGNITINTGVNADITVTPNGTGNVRLGDTTASGVITTGAAAASLTLSTNNGTNSGTIVIAPGVNGNITLTPNGTGLIDLGAVGSVRITGGSNTNLLSTNGSGVLSWVPVPSSMVYPASGIPNSTGSAWGTSYSTTGSSTVVALGTSPSFVTDIRTPKVTTASAVNLVLDTNAGTTTGSITINTGSNGNITLLPNGTGQVLIGSTTAGILNIQGASTAGTATITTNVTTGAVSLMTGLTTATMTIGSAAGGRVAIAFNQASTSTTTGALTVAGGVGISGALNATTKSFIIDHPTKAGKLLRHGSLEGPEFGVYVRGKLTNTRIIELPEYWTGLVDADSITVDLTPIGKFQKLYVEKIENNNIYIDNDNMFGGNVSCFYTVWATRRDVDTLEVEGDE
jgi:hypothetical protein